MANVVCPAGTPVAELSRGGRLCGGCLCRVTDSLITPVDDPTTYVRRCTQLPGVAAARTDDGALVPAPDGYTACTVWRADKRKRIVKRFTDDDQDWWQEGPGGRIEYIDRDKKALGHEEALADA